MKAAINSTEQAERLLNVREAAEYLGLQPSTLYQWAYERKVPTVKLLGKSLRFRRSDLDRIIDRGVRPALESPAGRRRGRG